MDPKTESLLKKVNRNLPTELAQNTTKMEVDTTEEDLARAALQSPDISKDKKRRVEQLLKTGKFRREEEVVNEAVVKQIDQYHSREINKLRRAGKLPDPMKDPFYRKRMERIASGDIKKAPAHSRQEIENARRLLRGKR